MQKRTLQLNVLSSMSIGIRWKFVIILSVPMLYTTGFGTLVYIR